MIKLTPIEGKVIEEVLEQVQDMIGTEDCYLLLDLETDIEESLNIIRSCNAYEEAHSITEEELLDEEEA